MYSGHSLVIQDLPVQFNSTAGSVHGIQCTNSNFASQTFMSMDDFFITDLEEFLRESSFEKYDDGLSSSDDCGSVNSKSSSTPTPSPTHNMEVPDFYYSSPVHSHEEFNMAHSPTYKKTEFSVSSPIVKDEVTLNSPQSLYHETNLCSPQEYKPETIKLQRYNHLVSLLSAPPASMANTINDNIISQLGHAMTSDNSCNPRRANVKAGNREQVEQVKATLPVSRITIKTEIVDNSCNHMDSLITDIKKEQCDSHLTTSGQFHSDSERQTTSGCQQISCDIGSLAMEQVIRDIHATCNSIGINVDPAKWSTDDVKSWLIKTVQELKLPMIQLDYFQMDGLTLCSLSESDFCSRAPNCGETLYAQLYIWKTACYQSSDIRRYSTVSSPLESYAPSWACVNSPGSPSSCFSPDSNMAVVGDVANPASVDSIGNSNTDVVLSEGTHTDDEVMSEDGNCTELASTSSAPPITKSSHSHIHLWQFLKELLSQPELYGGYIRWLERTKGIFKIEDSVRVARLWGKRKNRPAMNYDKLSRSIRQYYKKGIMKKTERSQRLVYQFCHPYCL